MLWMVIGLIVIVVLVLGGVWGAQRYFNNKLSNLDARSSDMGSDEIEKQIRAMKGLHLNGASLKAFTRHQREYQQLAESDGAKIETMLMETEGANGQLRFGTVREQIAEIDALISKTTAAYQQINAALTQIYQDEENNRKQLKKLRATYQDTRKKLLAKNFAYGDSMPALEERLKAVSAEFDAVDAVSATGDHQAAHTKIQELAASVGELADLSDKIPVLLAELIKEFPDQLDELSTASEQLRSQHFQFADVDIDAELRKIKVGISNSKTALAGLNVEAAAKQNKELAANIDKLYDVMQTELDAREQVAGKDEHVTQFIAHALRQNHLLIAELDHLNQSYKLTHDEIETAEKLRLELNELNQQHEADLQALADRKPVYSQIAAHFAHAEKRLREIEQQQHDINQRVSGLKAGEQSANEALEGFARDLRTILRELDHMQLPGLPETFREQAAHVKKEIETIHEELGKVKINLDDIGEQLIGLQSDMDDLKQAATEIVDAVGMTAQLLQAANRHEDKHPELTEAKTKSKALYSQMRYKEAADSIASALETAVPGSYQKAEDAYLSDKGAKPF